MPLTLVLQQGEFAVCRLDAVPQLDWDAPFISLTKTAGEVSLVCPMGQVPPGCTFHAPWRAFRIAGALDFSLVGILSSLSTVLAQAGISIFAVSTYDTDYILVPSHHCEKAAAALKAAGYGVMYA